MYRYAVLWMVGLMTFAPTLSWGQSWLSLNASSEYVDIGDLDVTGDQLTVEALIYQTQASLADIVSKHQGGSNVNYLLRSYRAEITTTNGYAATPVFCGQLYQFAELNTCLHIAMVYDGTTLSHFINGSLNSQTPATGDLIVNNYTTKIGQVASLGGLPFLEQFYGYIDEVRIWNVARTPSEIEAYRFAPLPSPATQTGLMAYYQFNSLTNLTGNATYDGTLVGAGVLGATNANCPALGGTCFAILDGNTYIPDNQPLEQTTYDPIIRQSANRLEIEVRPKDKSWVQIQVLAADGREVFEAEKMLEKGQLYLRTSPLLSPGLYAITIRQNGTPQTWKVWLGR